MLILRQLSGSERPTGRGYPLAVLPAEPPDLGNIDFERAVDSLDELDAADVEINGGG
jgi:hypothetical protein